MAWTVEALLQTLDATKVTPEGLAGLLGHSALVLQVRSLDAKIAQKIAERDAAMLAFEEELAALRTQRAAAEAAADSVLGANGG